MQKNDNHFINGFPYISSNIFHLVYMQHISGEEVHQPPPCGRILIYYAGTICDIHGNNVQTAILVNSTKQVRLNSSDSFQQPGLPWGLNIDMACSYGHTPLL